MYSLCVSDTDDAPDRTWIRMLSRKRILIQRIYRNKLHARQFFYDTMRRGGVLDHSVNTVNIDN